MTLKQSVCGFIGHKNKTRVLYDNNYPISVSLVCDKCGYKTQDYPIQGYKTK